MKKILTILALATVAVCCGGANYYRELLMLPRVVAGGGDTYYTDPYAANLIARYDFDATAWTNDVTANGFHLMLFNPFGATITNSIVGTNQLGRVEKALNIVSGNPAPRYVTTSATVGAWSNEETVASYWIYRERTNTLEYMYAFGSTNDIADIMFHAVPANQYYMSVTVRSNANTLSSDGYPTSTNPTNAILPNAWTHVCELRSKTAGSLIWINGLRLDPASASSEYRKYTFADVVRRSITAGKNPAFSLGNDPAREQAVNGKLDNARIYNSATATNNIAWLYQYTHPTNNLETR